MKKIIILTIVILVSSVNAGTWDRQYLCTKVGEKGITKKYTEVFDGKTMKLTYDGQVLHISKKNTYKLDGKLLKEIKRNKFHTENKEVVFINNETDNHNYLTNIEMTIIKDKTFYEQKEYYNCEAIDKYGSTFGDKYYIPSVKEQAKLKEYKRKEVQIKLAESYTFKTYCNDRFRFCVNYEKSFKANRSSDNGDGISFYTNDGFKMKVFGINNTMEESLENEIKLRSTNITEVIYQKVYDGRGIVLGYTNNSNVHIEILKTEQSFIILSIEYPSALKEKYEPITSKISASFKAYEVKKEGIDSAMKAIVLEKLNNYGELKEYGFNENGKSKLKHVVKAVYEYPYKDKKYLLVHAYSVPSKDFECHACSARSSFFIFASKNNNEWVLAESYVNVLEDGQWGKSGDYEVIQIGEKRFGLVSTSNWAGGGYSEGGKNIYIFENNEIKNIFNVKTYTDDSAALEVSLNSWISSLEFDKDGHPFYNIVMMTNGIQDGKKFSEKVIYKYNGFKYVQFPHISAHLKGTK